jgi:hypothetical protein
MSDLRNQPGHYYEHNRIDGHAQVHLGNTNIQNQIINAVGLTISRYTRLSQASILLTGKSQIPKPLDEPTLRASTLTVLYAP